MDAVAAVAVAVVVAMVVVAVVVENGGDAEDCLARERRRFSARRPRLPLRPEFGGERRKSALRFCVGRFSSGPRTPNPVSFASCTACSGSN